jgi:hypothetical protein
MTEAGSQYLESIAEDCAALLGPGIAVLGIERADLAGAVRLTVRYRLGNAVRTTVGLGETVVAAHAGLRRQLVRDRLEMGFTSLANRR